MSRTFPRYAPLSEAGRQEAASRNTDPAVWLAINYLVDSLGGGRGANAIWEDPTAEEFEWVCLCLDTWAMLGDIEPGRVWWGEESITVGDA